KPIAASRSLLLLCWRPGVTSFSRDVFKQTDVVVDESIEAISHMPSLIGLERDIMAFGIRKMEDLTNKFREPTHIAGRKAEDRFLVNQIDESSDAARDDRSAVPERLQGDLRNSLGPARNQNRRSLHVVTFEIIGRQR